MDGISIFATGLGQSTDLGTKSDIRLQQPSKSQSAVNAGDLLQLMLALGIVLFLLKVAVPKLVAKFGNRMVRKSTEGILIEESAAFGTGHLNVVTVRGRSFLVAVTPTQVSCLADLTGDKRPEPSPDPAFFELLDRATADDSPAEFAVVEGRAEEPKEERKSRIEEVLNQEETPDAAEIRARLDRLVGRKD